MYMETKTTTTKRRARKGGEIGANGEAYLGGQFIAETDRAKGEIASRRGPRRIEISPREFIVAADGETSIFSRIGGTWAVANGTDIEIFRPFADLQDPDDVTEAERLIAGYNAGLRIIAADGSLR